MDSETIRKTSPSDEKRPRNWPESCFDSHGMVSADHGLEIELCFSDKRPPEVRRMEFTVRPPERDGDTLVYVQTLDERVKGNVFLWRSGTMGFILALLDFKIKGKENTGVYMFEGAPTASPANSACGVIDKQGWLQDAFGAAENSERPIARQIFTVRKKSHKETIAFGIDSNRLPPENIRIVRGGSSNPLRQPQIQELYLLMAEGWRPHHKRNGNKLPPPDQFDLAKATAPQGPAAIESDKQANWVKKQREQDLVRAEVRLAEVDAKMEASQLGDAVDQCLAAENLFSGAECISGVVKCRLKLCDIHSMLGWKVENLDWLLNTLKLIANRGEALQVNREEAVQVCYCLIRLAFCLPPTIPEESSRKFLAKLQRIFPLAGEALNNARSEHKAALSQFLLLTAGEMGLAGGGSAVEGWMAIIKIAKTEDTTDMLSVFKGLAKAFEQRNPFGQAFFTYHTGAMQLSRGQVKEALDSFISAKELFEKLGRSTLIPTIERLIQAIRKLYDKSTGSSGS